MSAIIAGIGLGASALASGVYGISQNNKASAIEKSNIRPTQYVDPAYQQNVNQAQQMAQTGIPQEAYNNQLNQIGQNQAGAISQLNRSANPGAGLASVVRAGNAAGNQLNAEDAAARNRNMMVLMQQKDILANAKQDAWNYNYADKYSENLAKSQALRGAAAQNIGGAFNAVGSAGMNLLGSGLMGGAGAGTTAQAGRSPLLAPASQSAFQAPQYQLQGAIPYQGITSPLDNDFRFFNRI